MSETDKSEIEIEEHYLEITSDIQEETAKALEAGESRIRQV